uniref:ATP synthase subunit a n=1 Tax=Phyllodactylus unctus TaxID=611294 RepID=K9JW09_9SAUR|nr:ATP synthase F0 subunit 6 [Phyllodactylus unctus]ADY86061.1 ATPase subunit 6 [Phyllodactylus unctus]
MTMALFNQFATPQLLGIPLILLALATPVLLLMPSPRLLPNRICALQHWAVMNLTKHLLSPLNNPAHAWATPLLLTGLLLLTNNLLGLLPYTFTPTTQLSLNMALALPLWLSTVLLGFRTQPTLALAHLLPQGAPTPLTPFLVIIETLSLLIRPIALAVRLTANLTAGHLLMTLVSSTVLALLPMLPTIATLTLALLLLLTLLELAVAMIQAYVFTLLVSLYLQENT